MATVTSFESLKHPVRSELKQFAELFHPLFEASTEEARRQAVAALSQCPHVPPAVALFIGLQPISIAAIFLTRSPAIPDETLITIARTAGEAHARAIARRDNLSPMVIDALVSLRHSAPRAPAASPAAAAAPAAVELQPAQPAPAPAAAASAEAPPAAPEGGREEEIRREIKGLARHLFPAAEDRQGRRSLSPLQEALLVRFARSGDIGGFTTVLADALTVSRHLVARILADLSGHQLATTLVALGLRDADAASVLAGLFPALGPHLGHGTAAEELLESLDQRDCDARLDAWCRADRYTFADPDRAAPSEPASRPRSARPDRGLGLIGRAR